VDNLHSCSFFITFASKLSEGTESPLFHLSMINAVRNKVLQTLERLLADNVHFVVEVKISPDLKRIGVALDGDSGVDIDFCAAVSRELGNELETLEDLGAYVLEVSSPGADAPMKLLRQFPKHVGRELKVVLNDGTELKGILEEVAGDQLHIVYNHKEKGKKAEERTRVLPFSELEYAKVIISFK
jgi:ribosome maturation factor RimP